jgi:hypothetical protein
MAPNDAQEQLDFIKNVIHESRKTIQNDGKMYLLWGIIALVGLVFTYFAHLYRSTLLLQYSGAIWMILVVFGWILSLFEIKKMRRAKVRFFADRVLSGIWIGCGLAMIILGIYAPWINAYPGNYVSAVLAVVMGVGYFATGYVTNYRWFTIFGIAWWLGSLFMFNSPNLNGLLLFIVMTICFQVIPALIIYLKYHHKVPAKDA